ncbi:hypothetical protein, partial [Salmonella sp. 741265125_PSA]|uniref:hypothetical protein n=1 Tax=Salmonella sp. 741265125_PSA TaxID=3389044 RepID=UPI003980D693
ALQGADRKVKGVDVVTSAGWNRFRHSAALTRDLAHWSGAVRERSQTLVLFYGHAAAKPGVFAGRRP